MEAMENETIASALFANGVRIFGHHHKDGAALGIFCANGQCAQCTVLADGLPVKSCMELVKAGMRVEPAEGLAPLPEVEPVIGWRPVRELGVECLIIGGGPAGLSAAIELGRLGVDVLILDDKHRLGGKLVLQTHKFFGSVEDSHAGTRGFEIGKILQEELTGFDTVEVWLNTTAVAVFSDKIVGVVKDHRYFKIKPRKLLVATGAREKMLSFPGNTLPGVYGAGAVQTLMNVYGVLPGKKAVMVGAGNIGLIVSYQMLQAGMDVLAVVEAMPKIV